MAEENQEDLFYSHKKYLQENVEFENQLDQVVRGAGQFEGLMKDIKSTSSNFNKNSSDDSFQGNICLPLIATDNYASLGKKQELIKRYDGQEKHEKFDELIGDHFNKQICAELELLCADPFNREEVKYGEMEVRFSFKRFIFYCFIHFLYLFVLGPFLSLIMIICGQYPLAMNMGFAGFNIGWYYQTAVWACFIVSCILYFLYNEDDLLSKTYLLVLGFQVILRVFILGARYATTTESRIGQAYIRIFTIQDNLDEYLGTGWADVPPHIIDQEIKSSMVRNEIENLGFRVRLLHPLNDDYFQRFTDFSFYDGKQFDVEENRQFRLAVLKFLDGQKEVSLKSSYKIQDEKEANSPFGQEVLKFWNDPTDEELEYIYPARLIAKDCFLVSRIAVPVLSQPIRRISFALYALFPFFGAVVTDWATDYDFPGKYTSPVFWLYNFACFAAIQLFSYYNFSFLEFGRNDMKRKHFRMKVQSAYIEPNRLKMQGQLRLFPLFNFFDKTTMQSWLDSRILALDAGLRFYKRIEIYASIYLVYAVVACGLVFAQYFEVIDLSLTTSDIVFIGYEQFILIGLLYGLVDAGARVNQESEQQLLRLSELRIVLEKFLTDWDLLMNCKKVNQDELLNQTFKKGIHYFKYYQRLHGTAMSKRLLKESIRGMGSIQERLEQEKEYNPIKILGIPLTVSLMKWIQTGAGTLALLVIQQYLNKNS